MDVLNHFKARGAAVIATAMLLGVPTLARAAAPATQPAVDPAEPSVFSTPSTAPASQPVAVTPKTDVGDLTDLSLDELMNVKVTSVSKQPQTVAESPAAISVITQEDIRRSGFTSIPELLRLVPGMDVARVDANQWAVSARGFNSLYGNKLLVMSDGRSVYTDAFGGVHWEAQDTILEDIDRIEVVRGPGATLWGENAVNGVVNITTKSARDTQGLLVNGLGGNEEQIGEVRYGGQIDDQTFYRVFGKFRNTDNFVTSSNDEADDGWQEVRGGFRIDRYSSPDDTLTFQGDIYNERAAGVTTLNFNFTPPFQTPLPASANWYGGDVLGRWTHVIGKDSDFSLQLYYDRINRDDFAAGYYEDTFDADFQHRFPIGDRQEIIWGAGARLVSDQFQNGQFLAVDPTHRDNYVLNTFAQDDITIVKDRLHFFIGSKFEQNSKTGFEIQPSARLLWTPNKENSVWGAVSRAVRVPARDEEDGRITTTTLGPPVSPIPTQINVVGDTNLDAEDLTAFELGYRFQPVNTFAIDIAAYVNHYDNVIGAGEPGTPGFDPTLVPPRLVVPVPFHNDIHGNEYGGEISADWRVRENWRLAASYSLLDSELRSRVDATSATFFNGSSPRNQFQIRSYLDITRDIQFNTLLFYVERLKADQTPSYLRLDANISYRPVTGLTLTAGIQNILDDRHPEWSNTRDSIVPTEIPRTYYGELTYTY